MIRPVDASTKIAESAKTFGSSAARAVKLIANAVKKIIAAKNFFMHIYSVSKNFSDYITAAQKVHACRENFSAV